MTMANDYDAIILGAGAAGLMAAIRAAERGRRVLLLEKSKKAGVKILMSGGTRCNITHHCDARGIVEAFGKNGKFLHSALANFGVRDTVEFFHAEGVLTKVEDTGKIFPISDRALDVLNALLRRLARAGLTPNLGEPALSVEAREDGFAVRTPVRTEREGEPEGGSRRGAGLMVGGKAKFPGLRQTRLARPVTSRPADFVQTT